MSDAEEQELCRSELEDALARGDTLLNLYGDRIGAAGAASLAAALKTNTTITELDLWENRIGDAGAASLADALKTNTTITKLYLTGNNIGDAGAASLADALKTNTTITKLDLIENRIGDAGAASLADALKTNTTITVLYLGGNNIGEVSAASLADALKTNTTITQLYLQGNSIGDAGAASLADALKTNTTITKLDLGGNNIGAAGAASLADALKTNTTITELYLIGNSIGDAGAASLADALKTNTTITMLDLRVNRIYKAGAASLTDALKTNTTITELNVHVDDNGGATQETINAALRASREASKKRKRSLKAFAEALRGGNKPWNYAKLMLVGEGRAGKTSTMRAMLGLDFLAGETPTILAQTAACAINRTLSAQWQALEHGLLGLADEHAKAIASILLQMTAEEQELLRDEQSAQRFQSRLEQRLVAGDQLEAAVRAAAVGEAVARAAAIRRAALRGACARPSQRQRVGSDDPQQQATTLGDSVEVDRPRAEPHAASAPHMPARRIDMKAVSQYVKDGIEQSLRLIIYDLGGQTVFYSLHHLFLTRNGAYLVVFDMRRLIDTGAREPTHDRKPVYDPAGCVRFLRFWLCSIFLHAHGAPVLIIGTHKDAVPELEQHQQINGILHREFEAEANGSGALLGMTTDGLRLVCNEEDRLCFFPVDNSVRPTDPTLARVKEKLDALLTMEDFVQQPIPLTFLDLHDQLQARAQTHRVLQRVEVEALASGMPPDHLEAALQLFHNLGVITYFADERLRDRVVLDPQFLIDRFADVIRDYDLHERKTDAEARTHSRHWERLVQQGVVSEQLLLFFWKSGPDEHAYLTAMMEKLGLISPLPPAKTIEYLVPSTLPALPPSQELDTALESAHECTLRFTLCGGSPSSVSATAESELPFLPESLWARLLVKCAQISSILGSSASSRALPWKLSREWAWFAYEGLRFALRRDEQEHVVRVRVQHEFPAPIVEQLRQKATQICDEWMPRLKASVWIPHGDELYELHVVRTTLCEQGKHVPGPLGRQLKRADFVPWVPAHTSERYDVFISYRQKSEAKLAELLFTSLSNKTVGPTGRQLTVFFDCARLRQGERWDLGFVNGLAASSICVPLISYGTLEAMEKLDPQNGEDWCDNVLLEWMLTLELARAGWLKKVQPILIGKSTGDGQMSDFFSDGSMGRLKDDVSHKTVNALRFMASEIGLTLSEAAVSRTIKGTLDQLLKFQTTKWWDLKDEHGRPIVPNEEKHPFHNMCAELVFGQLVDMLPSVGGQSSEVVEASSWRVDLRATHRAVASSIAQQCGT